MTDPQGQFVWYELMTTDPQAAKAFYGKVMGWSAQDMPMPGMAYTILSAGEAQVAGLMDMPEDVRKMGVPPHWMGYVRVDDVDAAVADVTRLGGMVRVAPRDIPDVGRFAVVADPQTATFALFKPLPGPERQPVAQGTPGRVGWHELMAADWEQAFAFYAELFGWQKKDAIPIGDLGVYQLFGTGGDAIGGMFNKPAAVPVPFWMFYVNVDAIDAAADRVRAGGGAITNGPMQVPGGSWIVQCADPQGAMFALVSRQR